MIALYSRVSTAEQAREGYSIGEQQERLTAYCKSRGWSDFKHFTDGGFSGGNMNRPALQDMIKAIKQGTVSKVIVYKLDRLSRSQKDTLELLEDVFLPNNVDFISMCENFDTSSPFGKAMIGMFSVFAQLEREQIRERVTIGREARAKEGKWRGGGTPPVGYEYTNGELVINEFEAMQIREIFKLYLAGYTYTEIAIALNGKGWTHKYGSWQLSRVRNVLKNPVYMGIVSFGGQYQGIHEPIIDSETFEKVVEMMSDKPKSRTFKRRPINESFFVGKLFCGHCGARYTHTSSYTGHKKEKKIHYYSCMNRLHTKQRGTSVKCDNMIHRCDAFDAVVFDELRKLSLEDVKRYRKEQKSPDNVTTLQRELAKIEKQRSRLIDLYSLGNFDASELTSKIEPLTKTIHALEEQIASSGKRTMNEMQTVINSISDALDHGDPVQIRQLIDALIDHIERNDEDLVIYWNFD